MTEKYAFVCISSDFKGVEFIRRLKEIGHTVHLITSSDEKSSAWPWESIDQAFYMDKEDSGHWNSDHLEAGFAWFLRQHHVDRVVALDDYEVEKAAELREQFRIPGMGQTTARYFRDKLAMRVMARDAGIPIPHFSHLFHDQHITDYLRDLPGPFIVKPRSEAAAIGLKKVTDADEFWQHSKHLADERSNFLMEQFLPGSVYHVDGLVLDGKILFSSTSQYLNTPFEVAHGGGIFQSMTLHPDHQDSKLLTLLNKEVLEAFGMKNGAFHSEFIKAYEDNQFYFLETSSRVGGANLADMVCASSGINLWSEWAQIESDLILHHDYSVPDHAFEYAGIVMSLSKYENADTSQFNDPEIVWRNKKLYHIGFIVKSPSKDRVESLLSLYAKKIKKEFHASMPSK